MFSPMTFLLPTKSEPEASFCSAIILAAGASIRLGRSKQLLMMNGESLLRRTARIALDAGCAPVFVVLGSQAPQLEAELQSFNARVVHNREWRDGIASSLRCGLAAVMALQPQPDNLLISVCDQPRLATPVLRELLERHRSTRAKITASGYAGTMGVPAIFSHTIFPELAALHGDEGARRIIAAHQEEVELVDFPGGDEDIDTVLDLRQVGMPRE